MALRSVIGVAFFAASLLPTASQAASFTFDATVDPAITGLVDSGPGGIVPGTLVPQGTPGTVTLRLADEGDLRILNLDTLDSRPLSDFVLNPGGVLALAPGGTPASARLDADDLLFADRSNLTFEGTGAPLIVDFAPEADLLFGGESAELRISLFEFGNLPTLFETPAGFRISFEAGTTSLGFGDVFVGSALFTLPALTVADPTLFTVADFYDALGVPTALALERASYDFGTFGEIAFARLVPAEEIPLPAAAFLFLAGLPFLRRR